MIIPEAALGTVDIAAVNVYAELVPQELLSLTETVAAAVPAVSVIELVVLVPLHPVPVTDHL